MNTWKVGKSLMNDHYLKKKEFYSSLNMKCITNADYKHAKKIWEDFVIKGLSQYYNLYVQNNTLLLANVFGKFRNGCIQI